MKISDLLQQAPAATPVSGRGILLSDQLQGRPFQSAKASKPSPDIVAKSNAIANDPPRKPEQRYAEW